jgi:hypothetical protein
MAPDRRALGFSVARRHIQFATRVLEPSGGLRVDWIRLPVIGIYFSVHAFGEAP